MPWRRARKKSSKIDAAISIAACLAASREFMSHGSAVILGGVQLSCVVVRSEVSSLVLLDLSSDQEFFRETTARFLQRAGRRSASSAACATTRPASTPTTGAAAPSSAGPRCSSSEAHGGGSISGDGLVDLTLVAHEFGRHAAPGRSCPTNVVAAALSDGRRRRAPELLAGLLAGTVDRHVVPRRAAARTTALGDVAPRRSGSTATSSCSTA